MLCGGARGAPRGRASSLALDLHGSSPNVRLEIADISERLLAKIPDVLVDLLEVASYIYAADGAISRGGKVGAQMGKGWRRDFRFVIPVRRPGRWSSAHVMSALVETLGFLSDDRYEFEFQPITDPPPVEEYFEFQGAADAGFTPDEVILFSGGVDSFAGAVEALACGGKKIALVSHRSAPIIAGVQRRLVNELRSRFVNQVFHVPVRANLVGRLSKETTYRTRSFLFAALGAVTAQLFEKDRLRIYENGIVSLNLPTLAQVVGARATRTTHPQALAGFRRILSALLDKDFDFSNPFAWLTKAEVIERISMNGCGDLIRDTRSCTRVRQMTRLHSHCGACSQCLDRRFAVLAAGVADEDPEEAYKVDLLLGPRPPGPDRELALAYVRSSSLINDMADVAFFARYGEASRIVDFFDEPADEVARRILDLHRRQAAGVCGVSDDAISVHAGELRGGSLSEDCLLRLIVGQDAARQQYAPPNNGLISPPVFGATIRMALSS